MFGALIFALDLAAAPLSSNVCAPAAVQSHVQQAASALQRKDLTAAKTALVGVESCPVRDGPSYAAHVIRAEIASREDDWPDTRAALEGVGVHPEVVLSAHAGFLRLAADQGLRDTTAFTRDRAALLAANDERLTAAGRRTETFHAGAAQVTAYEAPVDQGSFHRVFEFIVTPDDPLAYPMSILLTDDRGAIALQQTLAPKGGAGPAHAWFIDVYTCNVHSTLPPPDHPFGDQPSYAEIKDRVVSTLSKNAPLSPPATPPAGGCATARWLLPGMGAR